MEDCIFCKIINGEIPCYKVYENNFVIAWLDIKPLSKGHVLVVPKHHSSNIHDTSEKTLCEIMKVAKKVTKKMKEELHPEAILINQNNGEKAGQTIMHYHLHIKPIYEDMECFDETNQRKTFSPEEMADIEKTLKIN